MRRLSYPKPVPPSPHAVMAARYATQAKFEEGILHEVDGVTLMAGTCKEGWFVLSDDGETTTERTFEKEFEAATFLMNLAAYAAEAA